jgi:hypothetical protein
MGGPVDFFVDVSKLSRTKGESGGVGAVLIFLGDLVELGRGWGALTCCFLDFDGAVCDR